MVIKLALAFFSSLIIGLISIPIIIKLCKEKKLYDIPDLRKKHKQAIPRLGGISFLPCMMLAFGFVLVIFSFKYESDISVHIWYLYLMFGFLIIYVLGVLDDVIGLSAKLKFIVQFVAASTLPMVNIYIDNFYGLFGIYEIPYYIGMPLTLITIVLIINSINLIDGIDGLSASLSIIALCGFIYLYYSINVWVICLMAAGLVGALCAFLRFNLFGNANKETKIFMGDSGSLTLGFTLASLFTKYIMYYPDKAVIKDDGIILAYSLLIIPVFDVFRVMTIRMRNRKPIFGADRNHLHHKLMDAGCSQHKTLVIILLVALTFIFGNYALQAYLSYTTIFIVDVVAFVLFSSCIRQKKR